MTEQEYIKQITAQFPETFKLRRHTTGIFRISPTSSYVDDKGILYLYTEIQNEKDGWWSYAKGTVSELIQEALVPDVNIDNLAEIQNSWRNRNNPPNANQSQIDILTKLEDAVSTFGSLIRQAKVKAKIEGLGRVPETGSCSDKIDEILMSWRKLSKLVPVEIHELFRAIVEKK